MTNNSTLLTRSFVTALALVVLTLGSFDPRPSAAGQPFEVDIAENGTRFVPDETPALGPEFGELEGFPAYGSEFITEGYIYPAGTLDNEPGVNADGSPQFPDLVIGTWTCRGWHVGEGAATTEGPIVVTTQIFDFGDTPGENMIVTEGFELFTDDPIKRPITGGTGPFATARGESVQTLIGINEEPFGVKLRVSFNPK